MAAAVADLLQELNITQPSVGSQLCVNLTHITDPGNFYVRPTAYSNYLPILETHVGPADASKLYLGNTVVFKSKTNMQYVRGQIRNIRYENEARVFNLFALDYGFTEEAVVEDLKKPLKDDPLPALVLHCELGDCQPKDNDTFDVEATQAMVYYVGNEQVKMVVKGKIADKYIVQLINSCPEDIAYIMALTEYTCLGYGNNIISRIPSIEQPKLYYTYKKIKTGDTLNVRVQYGDYLKSFYVCEVEDYNQYLKEINNLQEYYHLEKDFLPENLKRGSSVAVFCDWNSRYERAVITDVFIPEKMAIVQFVDWGINMNIYMDSSRLKTMSREYYFLRPAMAIYCSADEKQGWDNDFLYTGREFVATVKKVGYQFDSPNVVTISKPQK